MCDTKTIEYGVAGVAGVIILGWVVKKIFFGRGKTTSESTPQEPKEDTTLPQE